jgi:hypothetical protein
MNNKKSKNLTSISDLVKPIVKPKKTKIEISASVSDLIKCKKYKTETSTSSVSDLIRSGKRKAETSALIKCKKSKNEIKSKEPKMADLIKLRKRYLYPCCCIRCNGTEVDFRTQENHTKDESLWKSEDVRKNQEDTIVARKQKKSIITQDVNPTKERERTSSPNPYFSQQNSGFDPFNEDTDPSRPNDNENIRTLFSSLSSSKPSYFHVPALNENDDEYIEQNEDEDKEDENRNDDEYIYQDEDDEDEDDEDGDYGDNDNEDSDIENLFASPEVDSDEIFVMESLNDSMVTEIILWAFKFQQRFRLSDTALEALIKFLHVVHTRLDKSKSENFPSSLYLAKKMLNIFQPKMQLAVCSNCHKLHNVKNIVEYKEEGKTAIANCQHEEFPNNSVPGRRNKCNNTLSTLKKKKDGIIAVPRMLYPKPSIRQQLSMLYQRPGFEDMMKLSGIQREEVNIYSDIYDGKVWKTFPFDGSTFFTPETAMTHLGLLFNLDWF